MRKGFTLLELIIVIIIIGILATLGFVQYTQTIEKSRRAEAASILSSMRTMAIAYIQEGNATYPSTAILSGMIGVPTACDSQHYFSYAMDAATGTGTATRCTAGGKPPDCTAANGCTAYSLTLTQDGIKGSNPAGLW